MPKRIDTNCPRCGPRVLEATAVEVFVDHRSGVADYTFSCDGCSRPVRNPLHEAIIPLLAQAGAQIVARCWSPELPGGQRIAPVLTEAHVQAASALLDDIDPIVALLASDG